MWLIGSMQDGLNGEVLHNFIWSENTMLMKFEVGGKDLGQL